MNGKPNLKQMIPWLMEVDLLMNQIKIHRDHTQLMARLQHVTATRIDPEVGKDWRNRMIVRSRLKRYVSYH